MRIVGSMLIFGAIGGLVLMFHQPYMNTKVPTLQNQNAWQSPLFAVPGDECSRPVWDRDPRMHCPDDLAGKYLTEAPKQQQPDLGPVLQWFYCKDDHCIEMIVPRPCPSNMVCI